MPYTIISLSNMYTIYCEIHLCFRRSYFILTAAYFLGIQGFTGNSSANLGPSELMVETTHTCWPRGWLLNDRGPYQILIHIGQGLMQHPFLQNQTLFQMHHHIQNSCLL